MFVLPPDIIADARIVSSANAVSVDVAELVERFTVLEPLYNPTLDREVYLILLLES